MSLKPSPGTILIVDDEPDLREALSVYLERLGTRIVTAENGAAALERLRAGDVDAVLSDINMPVKTGLQLLREAREAGMDVPFVFITAYVERDYMLEAIRWGAMDFVEKPFGAPSVAAVMAKALRLGLALRRANEVLETAFAGSSLPPAEIARLKQAKRAAMLLQSLETPE